MNKEVVVKHPETLPGDYVAGFVDGEGCFALNFRRDVRHKRGKRTGIKPVYFRWDTEFAITLREDDVEILEKIKNTLNCGAVNKPNKNGCVRYQVSNVNDLIERIIPFFNKYKLHAKKKFDFELWKEAVIIFKRNQRFSVSLGHGGFQKIPWSTDDLGRLEQIHEEMRKYKGRSKGWKWLAETQS